jgi:hypothetical protein
MFYNIIFGICIVLFVIVFFLSYHIGCDSSKENLIPGFWSVSDEFKEQSKLDQLIIYFDQGSGYEYKGYMVITSNGDTLFNDILSFRIIPQGYFKNGKYSFMTSINTNIIPQNMTMEINVSDGSMELYDLKEKTLYARLYKDNQLSAKTVLNIGNSITNTDKQDTNESKTHDYEDLSTIST